MSDCLGNLVARTVTPAICVRPRVASIFEPPGLNAGNSELNFEQERFTEEKSLPRPKPEARSVSDQSNINRTLRHETEIIRREIIQPKKIFAGQAERRRADDYTPLPGERRDRLSRMVSDSSVAPPVGTVSQSSSPSREDRVATSRRAESNGVEVDVPRVRPEARPITGRGVAESPTPHLPVVPTQSIASKAPHLKPQRLPVVRAVVPSARSVLERPASTKQEPTISVTIGRVEIRAVPPPPEQRAKPKPATVLSLEDYLRQRASGGSR
jgi:hypothetical protein